MGSEANKAVLVSAGYHTNSVVKLFRLEAELDVKARDLLANRARLEPQAGHLGRDDPTEAGIRSEIRAIGERINALGGVGAMVDLWDGLDHRLGPHAATAVDHAWHGVGSWRA